MQRKLRALKSRAQGLTNHADSALEKYWVNVVLSLVVIAIWCFVVTLLLYIIDPFMAFDYLGQHPTLLGAVAAAYFMVFFLFCRLKGPSTAGRTKLLLIVAFVFAFIIYEIARGSTAQTLSAETQPFQSLMLTLWQTQAFWLGGWYTLNAIQTLLLIFRFGRYKLTMYWKLMPGGLILLGIGYGLSAPLALPIALTVPSEFFNKWLKSPSQDDQVLRGSRLLTLKQVQRALRKKSKGFQPDYRGSVELGGIPLPITALVTHLLVVGSPGAGKSILLKRLAQACLPLVIPGTPTRAVVFDPKHDALSSIMGIFPISSDIVILNCFDQRAARYDIAADITTLAQAQGAAAILIPEPKASEHGDRFFHQSARNLLAGIIYLFTLNAPGHWRLSDLVRAFDDEATVRAILGSRPETKPYLGSLGSEKTSANILSSVRSETDVYRPIAGLWERADTVVSLKNWLEGGQIWILGEAEEARPPMNALNSLILTLMGQKLLNENDTLDGSRTFFFLDELQSISIPILEELAVKGRSKGICLIAAFQSIQGMYNRYGKEAAESACGVFRQKIFLKVSEHATADWVSQQMGEQEVRRQQSTTVFREAISRLLNWSEITGATQSVHQQVRTVLPSEVINIPAIEPPSNRGLTGYYQFEYLHRHYEPWNELKGKMQEPDPDTNDFEPAPAHWQILPEWTEDDWQRLGISEAMHKLHSKEVSFPVNPDLTYTDNFDDV